MTKHTNRRNETQCASNIVYFSPKESGVGGRRKVNMPPLLVASILVLLVVFLSACGSTSTGASTNSASTAKATSTSQIKKHDTCAAQATLPADIPASGTFDTGANVITTFFNNVRQQEGCAVP